VYLLLARADPPAARRLCAALGRAVADNRIWVYYQEAPIVPLLRQADVRRAGCALRLPAARVQTPIADQEIWVTAARQLAGREGLGAAAAGVSSGEAASPAIQHTLRVLSQDDFALVRRNPPLLYHNDLTARTRRFYWSEDFGYSLWLRLFFAVAQEAAKAPSH
jgi:hypothetical protein